MVLVHGAYDAQRLHTPACTALRVVRLADTPVDDPDRPYITTIAVATESSQHATSAPAGDSPLAR